MQLELEKFRTRWNRWLGQKTREDRMNWIDLLNCYWSGWANKIMERLGENLTININSDRREVYHIFQWAIAEATVKELLALDNLYATERAGL